MALSHLLRAGLSLMPAAIVAGGLCLPGGAAAAAAGGDDLEPLSAERWGALDAALVAEAEAVRRECPGSAEPADCGALGLFYSRTSGLVDEPERVATLHRLACADGFPWACYLLAELSLEARGVPRHPEAARSLLESACEAGEARGCLRLGEMFESGDGVPVDLARAESLYEEGCAVHRAAACWRLAELLLDRRPPGSEALTERLRLTLRGACTGGIGAACFRLAELLEASEESAEAANLFGMACDRRYAAGCKRYADHLLSGAVVTPDPGLAAKLYGVACRDEVADACRRLAEMLRSGDGVEADPQRAAELERRARELQSSDR